MQRRLVEVPSGIPLGVAHVPYRENSGRMRARSRIDPTSLAVRTSLYTNTQSFSVHTQSFSVQD